MTPIANVNDRASVERIYPLDRFRQDANRNSLPSSPVYHGLTVLSSPDPSGAFHLQLAERQTGERDRTGDAVFLPATGGEGNGAQDQQDYAAFIDRVIEVARRIRPAGPTDERLHGFHGG